MGQAGAQGELGLAGANWEKFTKSSQFREKNFFVKFL